MVIFPFQHQACTQHADESLHLYQGIVATFQAQILTQWQWEKRDVILLGDAFPGILPASKSGGGLMFRAIGSQKQALVLLGWFACCMIGCGEKAANNLEGHSEQVVKKQDGKEKDGAQGTEQRKRKDVSRYKNLDKPDSVILFTKEIQIKPDTPAEVELEDGMKVEIPADALNAEKLVITKHQYAPADGHLLEEFAYYDFQVSDGELQKKVKLHFPLELSEEVNEEDVRVLHLLDSGRTEELTGTYSDAEKMFTVQTASFSSFSQPLLPNPFDVVARTLRSTTVKEFNLRPKYYYQFDHGWCWATSLSMLISSYGKPMQPQEIAALYGSEKNDGFGMMPIFGYSLSPVQKHHSAKDLSLTPYRFGGMTESRIRGFIMEQLKARRPVWIGLSKYEKDSDHVVMVTGYRHNGFIIHDPSGALVAHLEETYQPDPAKRVTNYANYFVEFDRWHKVVNPWKSQLIVSQEALPEDASTCSMQLSLGGGGVFFQRTGTLFSNQRDVYFYWNGEKEDGGGFSINEDDERKKGLAGVCNSDFLKSFHLLTHNSGTEDVKCHVDVLLDGKEILNKHAITFPAGEVNKSVPLYFSNTSNVVPPAHPVQPYAELASRNDLEKGLNFNLFPMKLGKHKMQIKLWEGKRQIDQIEFEFIMSPAIVARPEVEVKRTSSANQVTHIVRFDHSPEAVRAQGIGVPTAYTSFDDANQQQEKEAEVQIEYEVWQLIKEGNLKRPAVIAARLDGSGDGLPEVEIKIPRPLIRPGLTVRYYVVARDKKSGLFSPVSMTTRQVTTLPPTGPLKYRLTDVKYVIDGRQAGTKPKVESLRPGSQMRLNAGSFPPYEVEFDLEVPTNLYFKEFATLEKNHLGKPIYRGKNHALGLTEQADFKLKRVFRVTTANSRHSAGNFNDPTANDPAYELNVESVIYPLNFQPFVQAELKETKPPAKTPQYGTSLWTKKYVISPSVFQAAIEQNDLKNVPAPQREIVIQDHVEHHMKSKTPIELEYVHHVQLPQGTAAGTMNGIFLPDLDIWEKVRSSGGIVMVQMKCYIKNRYSVNFAADFYLIYRHDG